MLSSLAAVVGVASGIAAIGFRYLIWLSLSLFYNGAVPIGQPWIDPTIFNLDADAFLPPTLGFGYLLLLLILPLGGLLVGIIAMYGAPEVRGAGTPQVMEAAGFRAGIMRFRVVLLKSLASALTIGSGGSAGREGPIVQIGAASGSSLAQALKLEQAPRKILLACGTAGAIAATFNAPIAGVLFAVELVLLEFRTRSFIPLVISAVFATAVAGLFLPSGPQLPAQYSFISPLELTLFILLGLIAGLVAILWIRVRYTIEDAFARIRLSPLLRPAVGGALFAVIALFVPRLMGVGYATVSETVGGELQLGIFIFAMLAFLKMVATGLTLGTGGSGGEFAPSLFIGATMGAAVGLGFGALFPGITNPVGAYALVGMGALFAGASRATLTSIVIVFELTGDFGFILPLMLACVVADGVSILLQRETIYTGALVRKGIVFEHDIELNVLRTMLVRDAMVTDVATVTEEATIGDVAQAIASTGHQGFPVLDKDAHLVGIITHSDVRRALRSGDENQSCRDAETKELTVVHAGDTLEHALERMALAEVGHLPVVSEDAPHLLVGILSRGDIVKAYRRKALEEHRL
ncbi:MAG: chloride channel protein [Thermoplasmata archaeon]